MISHLRSFKRHLQWGWDASGAAGCARCRDWEDAWGLGIETTTKSIVDGRSFKRHLQWGWDASSAAGCGRCRDWEDAWGLGIETTTESIVDGRFSAIRETVKKAKAEAKRAMEGEETKQRMTKIWDGMTRAGVVTGAADFAAHFGGFLSSLYQKGPKTTLQNLKSKYTLAPPDSQKLDEILKASDRIEENIDLVLQEIRSIRGGGGSIGGSGGGARGNVNGGGSGQNGAGAPNAGGSEAPKGGGGGGAPNGGGGAPNGGGGGGQKAGGDGAQNGGGGKSQNGGGGGKNGGGGGQNGGGGGGGQNGGGGGAQNGGGGGDGDIDALIETLMDLVK
ncbi:unnamed protein product [Cuscuta campestris]|uniref:Uncharacterized protein n=1 Tax=Cuscuta campestris TaxID=132261 RepID=A0A484MV23_9ASTE|nr:unnamed protein product [Cuscuta campestris]